MANGRPLWFLGGVLAVWTGARLAILWPVALPLPTLDATQVAAATPIAPRPAVAMGRSPPRSLKTDRSSLIRTDVRSGANALIERVPRSSPKTTASAVAASADPPTVRPEIGDDIADRSPVVTPPTVSLPTGRSRLAVDVWLAARPGGGDNLAFGQLGASQGGARVTFAMDRRLALSGRFSTPLRGAGREIGVGIDLKPTRLPLHLLVEQRIDLDRGGTRPAVIAIAGGSVALPWRTRIDAYAQGGAVRRRGGFVDAAAVVARPLVARGGTRVEAGVGSWGAVQRGVARLDVGPSIALVTPGAGGTVRLQFDYRARIAGRARPGSGPALTLGGSF